MNQEIIIKREQYYTETEEKNISKLQMEFRHMHFSTYDAYRNYLHVRVGEYDDFNFYLEMSPREAEKLFLKLAEKAGNVERGF
ncbi:hypothetical protein CIL05_07365 [Virgibacillus profundi]|uniref:Uncharacterized protein n=1 Tax=Virgibacillus profundi TaxID=2024555 RepID=A0A2A2IEV7_9BACI|nr:hypothetical protein [Virgibacillus profundi]PAV30279.1 hypothetical protein CIL05_07365 [Virgibacillus profundi]PXY54451.1 hypothetical protein CIT14_07450 [Virgibacillus profundi]